MCVAAAAACFLGKCHGPGLNRAVDAELVIAKARGRSLKKPLPSERSLQLTISPTDRALEVAAEGIVFGSVLFDIQGMSARGHAAIQRALAPHMIRYDPFLFLEVFESVCIQSRVTLFEDGRDCPALGLLQCTLHLTGFLYPELKLC